MALKEVSLDLAAFLDSPEAGTLSTPREDVKSIVETFLTICYEEVGKKPRLLEGEDVEGVMVQRLPCRLEPKDPVAEHVPAVLRAYLDHLETKEVVPQAYEIRRALDESVDAFLEFVQSGLNGGFQVRRPQKPFVHGASKVGRNDPCSCGSGKKFKKCHGKKA